MSARFSVQTTGGMMQALRRLLAPRPTEIQRAVERASVEARCQRARATLAEARWAETERRLREDRSPLAWEDLLVLPRECQGPGQEQEP